MINGLRLTALILAFTVTASAYSVGKDGFAIKSGILFSNWESENASGTVKGDDLKLNLGLGYSFGQFYAGGNYLSFTDSHGVDSADENGWQAYGISGGWLSSFGLAAVFTYNLSYERSSTASSTTTTYTGDSSYLLDIAYLFEAGRFAFGPQFTYHYFEWSKLETETTVLGSKVTTETDLSSPYSDAKLIPYFTVWMFF